MKRFTSLPCYGELKARLVVGDSPTEIARWLHDNGHCQDLSLDSLRVTLYRFIRSQKKNWKLTKQQKNLMAEAKQIVDATRENFVDPQDVFNMLALFQVDRLMNLEKFDSETEIQYDGRVQREISLLRQTLRDFGDLMVDRNLRYIRNLPKEKLDTPQGVLNHALEKYGEKARILADPKSRRKVLNVLESLSSRADGPVAKLLEKAQRNMKIDRNDIIDVASAEEEDSND